MVKDIQISKNDVIRVDLSGGLDSEQGGIRYAVVLQNDKGNRFSSSTIIVPMTTKMKKADLPTHTIIKKDNENGLKADSMFLGEQIRVISKKRILGRVGRITNTMILNNMRRAYEANFM